MYKSLNREISGDVSLRSDAKILYSIHAIEDLVLGIFEKNVARKIKLNKETISFLFKIGKGGTHASPQRIYFRYLCVKLRKLTKEKKMRIIDVGCGSGAYSDVFRKCKRASEYHGIDILYNNQWETLEGKKDNLIRKFYIKDLTNIRTQEESQYDLSVSFSALEHIDKLREAVNSIYLLSKDNSIHYHAVPTHWSFLHYYFHGFRRFSSQSIKFVFERAGFNDVAITQLGGLFSFLLYILCKCNLLNSIAKKLKITIFENFFYKIYRMLIAKCIYLDQYAQHFPICYIVEAKKICKN